MVELLVGLTAHDKDLARADLAEDCVLPRTQLCFLNVDQLPGLGLPRVQILDRAQSIPVRRIIAHALLFISTGDKDFVPNISGAVAEARLLHIRQWLPFVRLQV